MIIHYSLNYRIKLDRSLFIIDRLNRTHFFIQFKWIESNNLYLNDEILLSNKNIQSLNNKINNLPLKLEEENGLISNEGYFTTWIIDKKGPFGVQGKKGHALKLRVGVKTAPKSVSFNVRSHLSKEIHLGWFPCHPLSTGAAPPGGTTLAYHTLNL